MDYNVQDTELKTLLVNYRNTLQQVDVIQQRTLEFNNTQIDISQHLWKKEKYIDTLQQKCGDGKIVEYDHEYEKLIFLKDNVNQLDSSLSKLSSDINVVLLRRLYEVKMARSAIQTWLDEVLWSLNTRPELISSQKTNTTLANTIDKNKKQKDTIIEDKKILSHVLHTLFSAERSLENKYPVIIEKKEKDDDDDNDDLNKDDEINPNNKDASYIVFQDQLHAWIQNIGVIYLKLADISEFKYILLQLLKTKNATSWGATLIQFIPPDNEISFEFIVEFIRALGYVFNDNSIDSVWDEDNYITCLEQFDIPFIFNQFTTSIMKQDHPIDDSFIHYASDFFQQCNDLVDVLLVGINFASNKDYSTLTNRISQQISRITLILSEKLKERMEWSQQCQLYQDNFIYRIISGVCEIADKNIWKLLPSLPYNIVSKPNLWMITIRLLQITDYSEPSKLQHVLKNPPNINLIINDLKENQSQGVFMISCLTNIVISVPSGVDILSPTDSDSSLTISLITVICYTFFIIAFVDDDLMDIYYKDVRDNFGSICNSHPFVISLLLRWTCEHISKMEGMALYLFRTLPLDQWQLINDDLEILHQLLRQTSSATLVSFAQYVINNLNFNYNSDDEENENIHHHIEQQKSTSFDWNKRTKNPFLAFSIHENIAFILLDSCQKYQSLHDFDKHIADGNGNLYKSISSASSTLNNKVSSLENNTKFTLPALKEASTSPVNINTASHHEFLNWCWIIVQRLKLYHGPLSSRAVDIDKLISLSFLRDCSHHPSDTISLHGALITYVVFLLSSTSRHFLRFESNHGWMKMLLILRRGYTTAAIEILGEIIPGFVYLYGDDFFSSDDTLVDYLKNMIEHKKDPMLQSATHDFIKLKSINSNNPSTKKNQKSKNRLVKSTNKKFWKQYSLNGISFIIGSHAWHCHLIDICSGLSGFSYLGLILCSWLGTIIRKEDWMWHTQYVTLVDDICYISFILNQQPLILNILENELERLQHIRSASQSALPTVGSPKLVPLIGQSRNALKYIKNMLPDTAYLTMLTGEWSMLSLTTSNLFKTPGVESDSLWFAFYILFMEIKLEQEDRHQMAQLIIKSSPTLLSSEDLTQSQYQDFDMKTYLTQSKKPIEFYGIYRLIQHILIAPLDHPVVPLLLQLFFCLYYANVSVENIHNEDDDKNNKNKKETKKLYYGSFFFIKKQDQLLKLRDRIASIQTYHGQYGALSPINDERKKRNENSDLNLQTQQYHERLRQVYHAMWLWLGENKFIKQPNNDENIESELDQLSNHYCAEKLKSCFITSTMDQWEKNAPWNNSSLLWYDLVEMDELKLAFDQFPWIDSESIKSHLYQKLSSQ
ncbi:unnamed protein product [Cunninghamella blakesleeana]